MDETEKHVIEIRRPAGGWPDLADVVDRTRRATAAAQQDGMHIRLLRSVFLPEEQTCLLVFQASGPELVRAVGAQAGLTPTDITDITVMRLDRRGSDTSAT